MNSEPFFSVIIPTYNRAEFIEAAIASVLAQTFESFEVIVVDDGSTDDTAVRVKAISDPRVRYTSQENSERGHARNTGTTAATGAYVTFLDSDDLFYPEHLNAAAALLTHGEPEIGHLRYELVRPADATSREMPYLAGNINRQLISGNFMSCNAVFLRLDVAQHFPFNENRILSGLEDWELWLRIAARYPIVYSNTITSAIVEHDQRSVLQTNKDELIQRTRFFLQTIEQNATVKAFCGKDFRKLKASCETYISLHIALTKSNRGAALHYLFKGVFIYPRALFQRRTLAIFKHVLIP